MTFLAIPPWRGNQRLHSADPRARGFRAPSRWHRDGGLGARFGARRWSSEVIRQLLVGRARFSTLIGDDQTPARCCSCSGAVADLFSPLYGRSARCQQFGHAVCCSDAEHVPTDAACRRHTTCWHAPERCRLVVDQLARSTPWDRRRRPQRWRDEALMLFERGRDAATAATAATCARSGADRPPPRAALWRAICRPYRAADDTVDRDAQLRGGGTTPSNALGALRRAERCSNVNGWRGACRPTRLVRFESGPRRLPTMSALAELAHALTRQATCGTRSAPWRREAPSRTRVALPARPRADRARRLWPRLRYGSTLRDVHASDREPGASRAARAHGGPASESMAPTRSLDGSAICVAWNGS